MLKKIAIIIPMFFLCLGLDNCKSPEEPEPEPIYEYRYNVEVIYTRVALDSSEVPDYVKLHYILLDPGLGDWSWIDSGYIEMNKIEENKYRCYLPKVFVQNSGWNSKHRVIVTDNKEIDVKNSYIIIQGAYDYELNDYENSRGDIEKCVYFKMSKE